MAILLDYSTALGAVYYLPYLAICFAAYEGFSVLYTMRRKTFRQSGYTLISRGVREVGAMRFHEEEKRRSNNSQGQNNSISKGGAGNSIVARCLHH